MSSKEHIKTKNDYEVCRLLLMSYIEKGIDECIYDGHQDYRIDLGTGFFKDKKKEFVKDVIIPQLTIHNENENDNECSSYKNGYYYYKNDCMCPYEVEYSDWGGGILVVSRVESSDEESEESEGEEDEWNNDPQCFGEITDIKGNVIKNPTELAEWMSERHGITADECMELFKTTDCGY